MKLKNVLIASICLLLFVTLASASFAQRLVLFETFTNEDDPCATGGGLLAARTSFNESVTETVNQESGKIIHLNHHYGNESDDLSYPNSGAVATQLGAGTQIFLGAVDRSSQIYSSSNTTVSNRLSTSPDDWSQAIEYEAGIAPEATLFLVSAQLDTVTLSSTQNNVLLTNVSVTLNQAFPNGLVIGYAILQDNVNDAQCGSSSGPITLNDVVRYCSIVDTGTFIVPASQAGTVNVYGNQEISARTAQLLEPWNYNNLRLVAWLEENPNGNFDIVNAATLVTSPGMNSLPLPQSSLTLIDSAIDGHNFYPTGSYSLPFFASNVSAVDEYLSTDGGNTWSVIADSSLVRTWPYGYVYPTFPNVSTTQGKIKLVSHNDPSVSYIESGTFNIIVQPTLTILHPQTTFAPYDTLIADSSFLIQWSDTGVGTVKLEYAYGQEYKTWNLIADKVPGNSYLWNPVPDTYYVAKVRITDDGDDTLNLESDQFVIKKLTTVGTGGVETATEQTGLTIISVAPNPAQNGEQLVVRYADANNAHKIDMELLDLLGRTVESQTLPVSSNGEADITTQSFSAGAYIIRMNDGLSTVTKRVEIIR